MEKAEIKQAIADQQELTKKLTAYYRTAQTEILQYLDDNLFYMSGTEAKMIIALFITGRQLNSTELSDITGLHANTIRQNIFSDHVKAVTDLIIDDTIND